MTEARPEQARADKTRTTKDRRVKLGMLAVLIAVIAAVYVASLRMPGLPKNFSTDLDATLALARREKRTVLVLFWADRVNEEATRFVLGNKSLKQRQVTEAIERGRHLCVGVKVDRKLGSEVARKYGLERLPTIMMLSPEGRILDRRSGRVGHATVAMMLSQAAMGLGKGGWIAPARRDAATQRTAPR